MEDVSFRHSFLNRVPVWRTPWVLAALLVVVNAIVFGLIHFTVFHGNAVATIPYMAVGLLFNLAYLWTRNLWTALLAHMLFNSTAVVGSFALLILL